MNQDGQRFFVGHICGDHIYGEDFHRYKRDYDAARDRQDLLVASVRSRQPSIPFWLGSRTCAKWTYSCITERFEPSSNITCRTSAS
jgi:hypothetical protein